MLSRRVIRLLAKEFSANKETLIDIIYEQILEYSIQDKKQPRFWQSWSDMK